MPAKQTTKQAEKKVSPPVLTKEQQEAVVEEYLGVHPKYFLYRGLNIQLNHGKFRTDGNHFNGWKPKAYKYTG